MDPNKGQDIKRARIHEGTYKDHRQPDNHDGITVQS